MVPGQRLEMRQGQSLVMTPQLQQAIKLLQMSNFELQSFVDSELERNPLLERSDGREAVDDKPFEGETGEPAGREDVSRAMGDDAKTEDKLASLDTDLGNVYTGEAQADIENRTRPGGPDAGTWNSQSPARKAGGETGGFDLEATLAGETTLASHLSQQMTMAVAGPARQLIGAHLIGMINDDGYLTGSLENVAGMLGADLAEVKDVLAILQTLEPAGIFARDLGECLALQLKEKDRLDPAMAALVDNLDLLAKHDFKALAKICQVGMDDLKDMAAEIRDLNPRPGSAFGAIVVQPVVPDIIVRPAPDGTWLVELNSETLPRVLMDNQYYATVTRGTTSQQDKLYLSECHASANWLIKSLAQRARTILAVGREIVRQQDGFLINGVQALKPLNLRNVAEKIEMHESTVSRVTSNKYMATPRGIFELKYFFTTAISAAGSGDDFSSEAVRHLIREMIEAEAPDAVLSDDMIVKNLTGAGIEIARRTVAKYRESMKISSSVQRRREKRAYR